VIVQENNSEKQELDEVSLENGTDEPPPRDWGAEVRRVAGPAILQSFAATLVFAVDRVMLGHAGREALASMQLAGPLEWSIISIFSAFEVAAVARVGAHVGAENNRAARQASRLAVFVALVAGALVAVATPGILHVLLQTADPRSSAGPLAASYLTSTLLASPLVFLALALTAISQARGDTRTPLLVAVFVQLVHLATNRVLILGAFGIPAYGIRGAGISTAITFSLQAGLLATIAFRRGWLDGDAAFPPGNSLDLPTPTRAQKLRAMLAVGGPALGERAIYHTGFLAYVAMIAGLGDVAMAANQSLIAIESVCFNAADGFGAATAATMARARGAAPLCSRALGAPSGESLVLSRASRDALALLAGAGLLAVVLREPLLALFGRDAPVLALGARAMPVLALAQPWMALGTVYASALRGVGKTRPVLGVSLLGAFAVRIAATWFFAYGMKLGLVGIWLGSTTDWVVRTLLLRRLVRQEFAPR
jgi:putative MATE family efflux protein